MGYNEYLRIEQAENHAGLITWIDRSIAKKELQINSWVDTLSESLPSTNPGRLLAIATLFNFDGAFFSSYFFLSYEW